MWHRIFVSTVAAVLFATPVIAQSTFLDVQNEGEVFASDLIGKQVVSFDGDVVGEIDDLILDREYRVVGTIIVTGGFLGMGGKEVGVPIESLQVQTVEGEESIILAVAPEELGTAPAYRPLEQVKAEEDVRRALEEQQLQQQQPRQEQQPATLPE